MSGVSSVFPRPFLDLADALHRNDDQAAAAAQDRIKQAVDAVNGADIALLKAGLSLQAYRQVPPGWPSTTNTRAAGNPARRSPGPDMTRPRANETRSAGAKHTLDRVPRRIAVR